jgi:hypothetical protein
MQHALKRATVTIRTLSSTFTIDSLRFVTVNRWFVPTIGRTHKTMIIVTQLHYNVNRQVSTNANETCMSILNKVGDEVRCDRILHYRTYHTTHDVASIDSVFLPV